jgi:diguanylate cyclase (GGDEF)-like protein
MKTILVIEDERSIRDNLLKILSYSGFRAIAAADGLDGVYMAKTHVPDLIVCDILMPDLDGYGVLTELLKDSGTAKIPFIFLSAKADRSDTRVGMNLGADDYLTKPFSSDELIEAVTARLEKQAAIVQPYLNDMEQAAEDLNKLAYSDPLTNLPNRILLRRWISRAIEAAQYQQQLIAVLCLDLDNFRGINSSLGYATGDLLLKAVAARLTDTIGQENTVTRLDGDEFGLLLVGMLQKQDVTEFAQNILDAITAPYLLSEQEVCIQASIGIALYPEDGSDSDKLLTNADAARRFCRNAGGGSYQFYSPMMEEMNVPSTGI